jgi:copper amine oxidase-like protein
MPKPRTTLKTRQSSQRAKAPVAPAKTPLKVKVVGAGPQAAELEKVASRVLSHAAIRKSLGNARHRLLTVEPVEREEGKGTRRLAAAEPVAYRATIYDYTKNQALVVDASVDGRRRPEVAESGEQPPPTRDEFDEAVRVLATDRDLGADLRAERLRPYPPMPPLVEAEGDTARSERTIAVGLLPAEKGARHEIVGVNLVRRTVVRFTDNAPETAAAHNPICGIPYNQQPTTGRQYVPGQAWVTVSQGSTVLWKFLVLRPAATQGPGRSTNGTGIELRSVTYRGKKVFHRAHVPILNVKYDPGGCGPYRDWQNEEGKIHAQGADVAPGFRLCPQPAKTILDTGSDAGNFLGVGIYVKGQEVVLVSEMEAGWYRYISEWRLHADGTIRPRFAFTAVENSCVCNVHHHHVYWRFDFDLRTPGNNVVKEFNDPPLPGLGTAKWHTKPYEIQRPRAPKRKRKWRVENSVTGEAYDIIPGHEDGVATAMPDWPFPRGDVWFLRYHPGEIDDGCVAIGPPYAANLGAWVNGESIRNQDVVMWYAGHFTHDLSELPGHHGHIVGPTLKPVRW